MLDALETGCRNVRSVYEENGNAVGEDGGFPHVSGLRFAVDTSIESSVVLDENEMFAAVEGPRRVKDVCVLNDAGEYEPIDPEKTYRVTSNNYLIKEGGNGFSMFRDNVLLADEIMQDYQVLLTYLEQIGGVIGEEYANVEGRIIVE